MKKNFRRTLGSVAFTTIFLLFNFHFSSCKAHTPGPLVNSSNLAIQALDLIPAGSTVQLVCTGNISCDTSGNHTTGGTKMIAQFSTPNPILANAVFQIKILNPNGDPIKFASVDLARK
jgi:hypothetical protein